jgi:topoisomerase-4 subunit B
MGKNTPTRQEFIIDNLRIELDVVEEKEEKEEVVAE